MEVKIRVNVWKDEWMLEEGNAARSRGLKRSGVQATAACRSPDGTSGRFATTGALWVRDERRREVAKEEARKLERRLTGLGLYPQAVESAAAAAGRRRRSRRAERARLLEGTLPSTEKVLDLIDQLSKSKVSWTYSRGHGLRCSVTDDTPRLEHQEGRGANGTEAKWSWAKDGSYDCLCPLALNASGDVDLTEGDLEKIHMAPSETARALATAAGAGGAADSFDEQNAAWGLLVAVSDGVPAVEWTRINLEGATGTVLAQAERTHHAIEQYSLQRLRPTEAARIDYDVVKGPGDMDELLEGTLPNTALVFEIIDDLAMWETHWAYSTTHGLRGSINGKTPGLGADTSVEGATTPPRRAWIDDGTYGCLPPLLLHRVRSDNVAEADLRKIEWEPLNAARAAAVAAGTKVPGDKFDEQNAAWGLLTAISNGQTAKSWAEQHLEGASAATIEGAERTHHALEQYALEQLQPNEPETADNRPIH